LPTFLDPLSLLGDGVLLAAALAGGMLLRRRFAAAGPPGPRAAAGAAGGALLASLLLSLAGGRGDGPPPEARRIGEGEPPDVLLVVVDTLRADAVGFSGAAGAPPTPALDALAAESAVFEAAAAPSSWTKPSTASLLTGTYPAEHGALDFESVVPGEATTLAEVLGAAGWRTAAFADNPFVSPEYGFAQGFGEFTGRHPSPLARGTLLLKALSQVRLRVAGGAAYSFGPGVDLGADPLLGKAVSFLAAGGGRPSFAYVHLIEPHYPYTPPPPFDGGRPRVDPPHSSGILPFDSFPALPAAEAAAMRANYGGEASAADAALGRALGALRRSGRLDRTLVIVTSDHGEEFHEHGGWTHGQSLFRELVHVPLLLRAPRGGPGAGRRIATPVSLVDVAPTVAALAGVATSARFSGRSLLPLLEGESPPPVPVFAEIAAGPVGSRAVVLGPEVFIEAWKGGSRWEGLYDLRSDPGQARNLAEGGGGGGAAARMRELLRRGFAAMEEGALRRSTRPFDEETRRALEAIGYTGR
ncbi:MAG: sulfatase, partial [Planctomycetes bacterium]|nr:sulfatase [Planctomycetota bacterium]